MYWNNIRAFGFNALYFATVIAAGPLSVNHVVHERRVELIETWRKLEQVHPHKLLPVRIGLTQRSLHKGHDMLMEVSDPSSPKYGKYYTAEEIHDFFSPVQESINSVVSWVEDAGFNKDRISLSTNKQWVQFEATSEQLGYLLRTQYHVWEHVASGSINLACDEYSIPTHLRKHIDYVTPGTKLHTLSSRDRSAEEFTRQLKKRERHSSTKTAKRPPPFHGLQYCAHSFSPQCIKALYRIPEGKTAHKGNELGLYESVYDIYNQEDADKFYKAYYPRIPQGTAPDLLSIDGAAIDYEKGDYDDETILDLDLALPIIYPQRIKIFEVDFNKNDQGPDYYYHGWFNTFLDAIDGSYCNYTSNGITGNSPGIDPQFPNNSTWKHPLQCGVYKPTNVISISYGHAEAYLPVNYIKRQCNEYMKLGLQGISILYCTQDGGAEGAIGGKKNDCLGKHGKIFAPIYPVSCPYVTAVGATRFNGADDDITNHTQELGAAFSGGGFSNIFATPDYQKKAVSTFLRDHTPPYKSYNTTDGKNIGQGGGLYNRGGRGYPDVSAIGTFALVVDEGGKYGYESGTSASTPIVASMLTLINEERLAKGKSTVGFVNPTFYAHPEMFNDITRGYNYGCPRYRVGVVRKDVVGYNATNGWDPVTGLGSPDYPSLLKISRASLRSAQKANSHHILATRHPTQLRNNPTDKMLEARLEQAAQLKKVVDAIRDLVQDCNFDCNDSGIALQAMDNSHVALVSMLLNASAFSPFRCDRNIALGINLTSLTKVLRCAQNEDIVTIKAEDAPDVVNLVFESSESDRLSEYDIKLMDIDQEHLGIPETAYAATITMPSPEFQRICRDLNALSESVAIECTKEGVKFACAGDIGSGSVMLRTHTNVEDAKKNVEIALSEPVALTFSLKYLVNFCKASGLSDSVKLCLSNEVPLLVEYNLSNGSYLRFYLAPKIGDEE